MAAMTFNIRAEWANVDGWLDDQKATPVDPGAVQLIEDLGRWRSKRPWLTRFTCPGGATSGSDERR